MIRERLSDDILNRIINYVNTNQTLVFMIGVPASGKSYISNIIASKASNCVRVNMDDIMEELYGTADVEDWREVNKLNKTLGYSSNIIKNTARDKAKDALKRGQSVVYDATNLRTDARIKMLRSMQYMVNRKIKTMAIIVNADIDTVKFRNSNRERTVQWFVIRKMYREAQLPIETNNHEFDEVIVIDNSPVQ
jgi:predicted kinase